MQSFIPLYNPFMNVWIKQLKILFPGNLKAYLASDIYEVVDIEKRSLESEWNDIQLTHPATVLSSIAILRCLEFYGLKPDVTIGHGFGDITALHAAGAYNEITAVRIAALRAKAIASLKLDDTGAMVAISSDADSVQKLIRDFVPMVTVSCFNSSKETVVSGTNQAIRNVIKVCKKEGIHYKQLRSLHAFHSNLVAGASDSFCKSTKNIFSGSFIRKSVLLLVQVMSLQKVLILEN